MSTPTLGQWPGADQLYDLSGADVVVQRRSPLEEALGSSLLKAAKDLTDRGLDYSGDARAQIADFTPLQQRAIDEMDKVPLQGPRLDPVTEEPVLDEKGNMIIEPVKGPDGNFIMVSPFVQNQMMAQATGDAYLQKAGEIYGQSGAAFFGEGGPRDQALQSLASIGDVRDKASSVFGQNLSDMREGIGAYQQNLADNLAADRDSRIDDDLSFNTELVDQEKLMRKAGDSSGISSALTSGIRGIEGEEGTLEGGILNTLAAQNLTASDAARKTATDSAQRFQKAGEFGQDYAKQGIGSLAGTTDRFAPDQISPFMNTFEDAAVQQALADIDEQRQSRQMGIDASAAAAGAFGGSRHGVQSSELDKSTLEQQARTAAQMRQAGFESAAQRAQQAYEQQQGRAQQAAQLTGALGAQGAQAAMQAAQQQGTFEMSAEELASKLAQQQAQTGLSAEQLMAQMGIDTSKMDLATEQAILNSIQNRRKAQMESYDFDREGYKLENQQGMEGEKLGLQGSQIQAGLYNQDLLDRMNLAKQFEDMATNQAHYTQQAAGGLGSLVSQQGNFANLMQNMQQGSNNYLFNLGTAAQNQQQAEIDAARENALKDMFKDHENLSIFHDYLNKTPGSNMTFSQATKASQPSRGEKLIGLAGQIGAGLMGANTAGGM